MKPRGLILGLEGQFEALMVKGGGGRTEGRKDGHLEIPPCVLQDIGPLGLLPEKREGRTNFPMCESIGYWPHWGRCPKSSDSQIVPILKICQNTVQAAVCTSFHFRDK